MPHPIALIRKAEWNQWLEKFKETFALKLLNSGQGKKRMGPHATIGGARSARFSTDVPSES
jgi:hypothetical protein